jgi:hypothetical protein
MENDMSEERYKMALEAIIVACESGSGSGSWLNAAFAMKHIAQRALEQPPTEKGE